MRRAFLAGGRIGNVFSWFDVNEWLEFNESERDLSPIRNLH